MLIYIYNLVCIKHSTHSVIVITHFVAGDTHMQIGIAIILKYELFCNIVSDNVSWCKLRQKKYIYTV